MIEALKHVIEMYPGWTMFCIVMLAGGIANRIGTRQ